MVYKYNNYIIRKILYIKMLIKIKIMELFMLGIKANSHYLRQVAFMRGKLPLYTAAVLA